MLSKLFNRKTTVRKTDVHFLEVKINSRGLILKSSHHMQIFTISMGYLEEWGYAGTQAPDKLSQSSETTALVTQLLHPLFYWTALYSEWLGDRDSE